MNNTTKISVALFVAFTLLVGSTVHSAAVKVTEKVTAQQTDLIDMLDSFNR
jgi:hypothetical protein